MDAPLPLTRRSSLLRSLAYLVHRWILHEPFLEARPPGMNFRVKTEDVVGRHIYKYHVHEPAISSFLAGHLAFEPGDVVFDIGANIGWYSVLLSRIAPSGVNIFSFEPDPLNFELLEHNLYANRAHAATPVRKALATDDGVLPLHRYDSNNLGRHSLLDIGAGDTIDVRTTSLDSFWNAASLGSRRPRFIKIDIEGYELFALQGAGNVLARCPELLCEFSPNFMRRGGLYPADLVALLAGHGFEPHVIDGGALRPVDEPWLAQIDEVIDLFWRKPGY